MNTCRRVLILFTALLPLAVAGPPALRLSGRYINSSGSQAKLIVANRSGDLFVISDVCAAPCYSNSNSTVQVTRTDLSGNVLGAFSFGGSGFTAANAAALDSAGNLVIGGSTSSTDFPLVSPLQSTGGAFLVRIDPQLHGVVWSTLFGSSPAIPVKTSALTLDANGNIYFAGNTGSGLPVTPGAFQTQGSTAVGATSAFVAEISASGSLVFATYYSGTLPSVVQGSPFAVTAFPPVTTPAAIALDSAGNIVIAGATSDNVPVTPGAYSTTVPTYALDSKGFVAKFKPDGTGLVWATYLPNPGISSMAQDAGGNILLAGNAADNLAVTPDAIQPSFPQSPPPPGEGAQVTKAAGLLLKLASAGDRLMYASYFGGNTIVHPSALNPAVVGLAIDDAGDVWITGASAPVALPVNSSPALGQNYIAELSPDLKTVLALNSVPEGSAGTAIAAISGSTVATLGSANLMLLSEPDAGPSFLGLASSPAYQTTPAISPGELVSLYGIGLGPAADQAMQIGGDGVIGKTIGGAQVLFNGTPAALLYAGPNQINAIVPETVKGLAQISLQVVTPSGTFDVPGLTVQDSSPALFASFGGVATPAVNEDGTINSPSNPAPADSIVAVWLTGIGSATGIDDQINILAPRSATVPISVMTHEQGVPGQPVQVLYAGDAPAQPNGVSQINFRLPDATPNTGLPYQSFTVQTGSATSLPFLIYVRQWAYAGRAHQSRTRENDSAIACERTELRRYPPSGPARLSRPRRVRPDSDVDLIADFDRAKGLSLFDLVGLQLRLSGILDTPVHLSDRRFPKDEVKDRAAQDAVVVF